MGKTLHIIPSGIIWPLIVEKWIGDEPDLPYYIQQKITNAVPRIVSVSNQVLQHIDENEYRTNDLEEWFLPFLLLPVGQAIQFVMEMDLDDASELRRFIGED